MSCAIHLTEHARERGKERLGLSGDALQRTCERAFEDGIPQQETRGSLRRWIDHQGSIHRKGNNLRLWGNHVFVFENKALITILHLPHSFEAQVRKLSRRAGAK